jgi:iron complex outermembrane receptor protein
VITRTALALCIGAILGRAAIAAPAQPDAALEPIPASQAGEAHGPTPADSTDHDDSGPHVETLDPVLVTALPNGRTSDQIVTPVSVLAGVELDAARAGTIGQTVAGIPGIQASAFGNGVGRPVIRGLDGSRVAVLANGLGAADVSNVSQDHAVTVEPFLADQIEILKGPSTLLYGSGAIGGVVNAVDGRIPERAPANGLSGRAQIGYDSVSDGRTGMFRVDAGGDGYALHFDGLDRDDGDYDIPGGTLANSFVRTRAGAVGASALGDWGFLGFSVSRYLDDYGNPAEPGDAEEPAVHIGMQQTRYDVKGALEQPFAWLERIEANIGHSEYQHTEFAGREAATTFTNDANEGRVLLTHAPFRGWSGAFGVQWFDRDFAAVGDETFVPPTTSRGVGVFLTEQNTWGPLTLELGARRDRQSSEPTGGAKRDFDPYSLSGGLSWRFDDAWHMTLNLDRAQRAPAEEELFSNGPHEASATFEVGNPLLDTETANQAELGLHYHGARIDAKVSAYVNRYDRFIYLADTGTIEDDLPVRLWSQGDAKFRGAEAEATLHLASNASGHYDLRVWGDRVRATLDDGGNLPRIPAARFGSQFSWHNDDWRASLGATRYFPHDEVAAFETETDGFTLVNARLAWAFHDSDRSSWECFVHADNLTDQTARLSTSLIRDFAPLPGRNVSIGLRGMF